MTYEEYLKTQHWNTFRRLVLERDGYRCVVCNSDKNLHVHHRHYESGRYMESLNDCYTLCKTCHEAFHKRKKVKIAKKATTS